MHEIEPYFRWHDLYTSEEDKHSPFFGKIYNEFGFDKSIYNYLIHPRWDYFGSDTLYLKILYADYQKQFIIIELLGEWNDCITNDVMHLKRKVVDEFIDHGINRFILIGENVLNFHFDMDDYYEEWFEDVEDGWIVGINFREHVVEDFCNNNLDYYMALGGKFNFIDWRRTKPVDLFEAIESLITKRLETSEM